LIVDSALINSTKEIGIGIGIGTGSETETEMKIN
jgi:hypothetical protein